MSSFVLNLFFLGFRHLVVPASLAVDFHSVIRGGFVWNRVRVGRVFEMQGVEHSSLL
jgi:hypothetical protein